MLKESNSLKDDAAEIQDLLARFSRTMKPKLWSSIIAQSGIAIDRPSAGILHMLAKQTNIDCSPNLLAQKLGVEAPFISRKLQELEDAGLIERLSDKTDRRTYMIQLTDLGLEVTEKLQAALLVAMKAILGSWSLEDRRDLTRLLKQLIEDISSFENRSKQTIYQKVGKI